MTSGSNSGGKSGHNKGHILDKAEVETLRQKVVELVTEDPRKAAMILADWVKKAEAPRKKKAA